MELPSPSEYFPPKRYQGHWVPQTRFKLGTRESLLPPVFLLRRCPKTRLSGQSSRGVQPSFTVRPRIPVRSSSATNTSLGVPCPYSAYRKGESTSMPSCLGFGTLGVTQASLNSSQTAQYGVARRLSQPLSDLLLPPPSCHFQTGNARGVCPSGVSSSLARPQQLVAARHALLPFSVGLRIPRPRRGKPPAHQPPPRSG